MAPYAVAVRCENTGASCTGTLITLDIVLTLARCFYQGHQLKESHSTVEVLAGVDTLANISVDGRTQRRRGASLHIHPNFRPTATEASFGYNDVALVNMEAPFNQTPTVRAISVGFFDWGESDTVKCVVASYAAVNPLTPSLDDDHLKLSEVVATRPCSCNDQLVGAFGSRTQRWLCVVPHKSGPTPCVGAGGAGLVCSGKLIALLVGLVPFQDLSNCKYSRKTTTVSCVNRKTLPIFLDLCPFTPWFSFLFDGLPMGRTNCSKASNPYSRLYALLIVVIAFIKGTFQMLR